MHESLCGGEWAQKDSLRTILIKKCFLFMVGSVCHIKRFTTGSRNCHLCGKHFTHDEEVEMEVQKWLRQQSKDFFAVGSDALLKQWDNVSMVVEDMLKNGCFFEVQISHVLGFISICDLYLLSVPQIS
jgi:hypothetical protein